MKTIKNTANISMKLSITIFLTIWLFLLCGCGNVQNFYSDYASQIRALTSDFFYILLEEINEELEDVYKIQKEWSRFGNKVVYQITYTSLNDNSSNKNWFIFKDNAKYELFENNRTYTMTQVNANQYLTNYTNKSTGDEEFNGEILFYTQYEISNTTNTVKYYKKDNKLYRILESDGYSITTYKVLQVAKNIPSASNLNFNIPSNYKLI